MDIKTRNRTELKSYFVKNAIPTESNFAELIDGMLNLQEDRVVKLPGSPLSIEATGGPASEKKALNFYKDFSNPSPDWTLSLTDPTGQQYGLNISDGQGNSRLFIDRNTGNIGVGTTNPVGKLQVEGTLYANKYVVQDNVDGGSTKGIWMWSPSDSNWGIYMGQAGAGKSLAGGNAVGGAGFNSHAIRLRTSHAQNNGLVYENSKEELNLSVRGSDGLTYIRGNLGVGTTAPTEKLDVTGTIKATDGLRIDGNRSSHIEADGALYRYGGQVYITVDDNLYIRDMRGNIRFHFDTNKGTIQQEPWKNIQAVHQKWLNPANDNRPKCFKDSLGIVHLKGYFSLSGRLNPHNLPPDHFGRVHAVLPSGYRPATDEYHMIYAGIHKKFASVKISSNGHMEIESAEWNTPYFLYGITFRAA